MNKKRFTDFTIYLEAFTQRIVQRYSNATGFIDKEKGNTLQRFPELDLNMREPRQRDQVLEEKKALELSVNDERSKCYHDIDI